MTIARGNIKAIKSGKILCLDPSSGSAGSHIGYAVFDNQELVDKGIIDMTEDWGKPTSVRLKALGDCLRESFPDHYDLIATEKIRIVSRGRAYRASESLVWAIGAVFANINHSKSLEIHPSSHISISNKMWDGYSKDDMNDAISIGLGLIAFAHGYEPKKYKNKSYHAEFLRIKNIIVDIMENH